MAQHGQCNYCKKSGGKEQHPKCCYECRKVRDWCQTEGCNNKSLLVTGYPPNKMGVAVFHGPKINRCIEKYVKNNEKELSKDPWLFMNHCCKHFEEKVGFK